MLTDEQIERYSRQIVLPPVGGRGQQQLLSATVLLSGAPAVVETAGRYLVAAGIGTLTLLCAENDEELASELRESNDDCRIDCVDSPTQIDSLVAAATVVAASHRGTATVLNSACIAAHKPLVWGAAHPDGGLVTVLCHDEAPCLHCLPSEPPALPAPSEVTVLATLGEALVGARQATEVIKLVLGLPGVLTGRLASFDPLRGLVTETPVTRDPVCPCCRALPLRPGVPRS